MDQSVPNLARILGSGVPPHAIGFYGRWWQLEDWLREVVYVELRAKHGEGWTNHLEGHAPKRVASDEANAYMASADAGELLAYADVSDLFRLIEDQWELFSPLLPPRRRWEGTSDELRELRNRNAHCRRPHRDDLARIEQTLRDLEAGAWRFYSSYLDTRAVHKSRDPVARAWLGRQHETAARLLDHAERQYDVRFRLGYSVRPWATAPDANAISGSEGVLWHARWVIGGRDLNVAELWTEVARCPPVCELLVHLLVDMGSVTATFAAVDDPANIADAIGDIFDDVLTTSRPSVLRVPIESPEEWANRWTRGAEHLPRRVQVNSPLTLVDPLLPGAFSIFAADS